MSTSPESTVWSDRLSAANSDGDTTGAANDGASATELRHDIDRTRAQMSGTIDAIQSRLAPQQLLTQAKDALAGSAAGVAAGVAAQAQDRSGKLAAAAQLRVARLRAEWDQMCARYPWLPIALISGAGVGSAVAALLVWNSGRARD